jgi:hypothetical protein
VYDGDADTAATTALKNGEDEHCQHRHLSPYRFWGFTVGGSLPNAVTALMPYFALIVIFAPRYD